MTKKERWADQKSALLLLMQDSSYLPMTEGELKELLLVYKPRKYDYLTIVFSLFSALGISLIPKIDEFKLFTCFPCCIINDASILYWSSEQYGNYLKLLYRMSLFE